MKQVVASRDDIAFYIKFFPLRSIHPDAYAKSKAVACQKDNESALKLLGEIFVNKANPKPDCKTSIVDDSIKLGNSIGLRATPTIIYQSGKVISGAPRAEIIVAKAVEKPVKKTAPKKYKKVIAE